MKNPFKHAENQTKDAAHAEESDKAGTSEPDVPAPFAPDSGEDSALGDTDEHSDA